METATDQALNFEPSRTLYDEADAHQAKLVAPLGLNEEVVRLISKTKNEPEWMLQKRLQGLKLFFEKPLPDWGPDLTNLDFISNIIRYFHRFHFSFIHKHIYSVAGSKQFFALFPVNFMLKLYAFLPHFSNFSFYNDKVIVPCRMEVFALGFHNRGYDAAFVKRIVIYLQFSEYLSSSALKPPEVIGIIDNLPCIRVPVNDPVLNLVHKQ